MYCFHVHDKRCCLTPVCVAQELPFPDGTPPPSSVVQSWLKIVDRHEPVALHCIAGLGRYVSAVWLLARSPVPPLLFVIAMQSPFLLKVCWLAISLYLFVSFCVLYLSSGASLCVCCVFAGLFVCRRRPSLRRAPMMVCIALIERGNMDPLSAIEFVRSKRPDAFNHRQISFLVAYKPGKGGCCVMV